MRSLRLLKTRAGKSLAVVGLIAIALLASWIARDEFSKVSSTTTPGSIVLNGLTVAERAQLGSEETSSPSEAITGQNRPPKTLSAEVSGSTTKPFMPDVPSQTDSELLAQQRITDYCKGQVASDNLALVNLNNQTFTEVQGLERQGDGVAVINGFIDQQNAGVQNLDDEDQSSLSSTCPGYNLTLPTPWPHIAGY